MQRHSWRRWQICTNSRLFRSDGTESKPARASACTPGFSATMTKPGGFPVPPRLVIPTSHRIERATERTLVSVGGGHVGRSFADPGLRRHGLGGAGYLGTNGTERSHGRGVLHRRSCLRIGGLLHQLHRIAAISRRRVERRWMEGATRRGATSGRAQFPRRHLVRRFEHVHGSRRIRQTAKHDHTAHFAPDRAVERESLWSSWRRPAVTLDTSTLLLARKRSRIFTKR